MLLVTIFNAVGLALVAYLLVCFMAANPNGRAFHESRSVVFVVVIVAWLFTFDLFVLIVG